MLNKKIILAEQKEIKLAVRACALSNIIHIKIFLKK